MQEQVGQQRAHDAALRRPFRPLQGAIRTLGGSTKPPPNVQSDPGKVRVMCHGPLDQIMRNGIKEGFDIQIDDPVGAPASLPRHAHRVERRPAGSIAVRIRVEMRFHLWFQNHLHDRLRHAIGNRRNAEWARAATVLRYLDEPHGRREVRARRHPIPDLVEVALQILLERRQGLAIHARSTSVRLHPLVGFPNELLRNVVRLCLRHRLLPLLVDQRPRLESRVPLLRPHYQASSLLRARPSLRLASVLGSSWVHHLEVSLGIEAQVPTFRTRACAGLTPSSCRSPLGQSAGILRASSQANNRSLVSMTSLRFRHVINGSLAFVFPAHT